MKLTLRFKTPDVQEIAVREAVDAAIEEASPEDEIDKDNIEYDANAACEKFVENGEYVTIEIDTDTGDATVKEV